VQKRPNKTLQHTVTHYNTLQHTAHTLQHTSSAKGGSEIKLFSQKSFIFWMIFEKNQKKKLSATHCQHAATYFFRQRGP